MRAANVLSLLLLSSLVSYSSASQLHSPLRVRFNSELLKGVFHKKDQDILDIFANISLGYFDLKNGHMIEDLKVSLVPQQENTEEFNYHLSFDEAKFLGMETQDLKFKGVGIIKHGEDEGEKLAPREEFEIEGPITDFRFSFEVTDNDTSKAVVFKSFDFQIDPSKTQIRALGDSKLFEEHGHLGEIRQWVNNELVRSVTLIKDDTMGGSLHYLQKLPVLNLMPLIALYHATNAAEKVKLSDEFLEYDFSPRSLKMIKKQRDDLLKPIDTVFAPTKAGSDESALQLIIDENFANAGFNRMISIDKRFSLREFMSKDPKFALFRQLLTTSTIGMALPSFKEEYGQAKPVDIISTVNHDSISEIMEIAPSGFTLDQKGNFKISMNIASQIIIERTTGNWEDSRKLVMTIAMKGKIFIADAQFANRTLVIMPRGFELTQLKIFKGDEEQFLEQMLAQSLIGVQLEQLRKSFKPSVTPLKNFPNPPELQCFGFNLTNMDVLINKGYLQINSNYIKIDTPSEDRVEFCKALENMLKSSPEKVTEFVGKYVPGLDKLKKTPGFDSMVGEAVGSAKQKVKPKKSKRDRRRRGEEKEEPVINIPEDVAKELKEDL